MTQSMTISNCSACQAASVIENCMNEEKTLCVKIHDSMARAESRPFFLLLRKDGEHLLVCQDTGMAIEELADEEQFNGDKPHYFSEEHMRVSPVYYLLQCKERIMQSAKDMSYNILPVLLTGCRIIHLEDMEEVWKKMGVVVHTEQRGKSAFSGIDIPTIAYQDLPLLIKRYMKTCNENKNIQKLLHNIDYKSENHEYKVFCESKVDENEDFEFSVTPEMPEMPEGIDNAPSVEMLPPIDNPQSLLDNMVGMKKIKQAIKNILIMSKYNKLLRTNNSSAKTHDLPLHALFLGGPGTGKTTLARIYGSLLKQNGILSIGHTVVCTRASFMGTHWGDEEAKTNIILDLAKGGVLFIDEAYLLNTSHPSDPGRNVLQLMLPLLADEEHRDIAVVLAGYTKPMQDLIDTNQGLSSRFTNKFEFQDLSFKELLEISRLYIRKYNYHFTPTAWKEYCEQLSLSFASKTQEWGNARFVHNMMDHLFQIHAMRCVQRGISGKRLLSLTYADVHNTPFPEPKRIMAKKTNIVQIKGFR